MADKYYTLQMTRDEALAAKEALEQAANTLKKAGFTGAAYNRVCTIAARIEQISKLAPTHDWLAIGGTREPHY